MNTLKKRINDKSQVGRTRQVWDIYGRSHEIKWFSVKTIIGIHIALLVLGLIIGFFAEYEFPEDEMSWRVLLFVTPFAALAITVFFGFFVLVSNASPIKYLFRLTYLMSVFGVSFGAGLIGQSITTEQVAPSSFFALLGSVGYLLGLVAVAKLQKWRHGEAF